jgi:hypothetical protein
MARKLIEQYRRLPDFDPEHCTPIKLSDGQEWYFAKPWLEITPVFKDGKAVDRTKQITCGPELDILIRAITEEEDLPRQVLHVMTLGALLLKQNYDLEDADFERLFIYRPGSDESAEMIRAIVSAATGKLSEAHGLESVAHPKA